MRLKDKVAIITGGSRGIGFATADKFLKEGASVVLAASSQESADVAVDKLKEKYPNAIVAGISPNLASMESVRKAFKEATEKYGCVDILVNNAGIIQRKPMLETTAADYRKIIDIDLTGQFIMAKAVLPSMIKKGHGKIINICSMMSELGRETVVGYASAKGGLKMLTKNICSEFGEKNIQCNGIGPGYIATPQTAPLREIQPDGSRHPFDQFIISKTPAGRWGKPDDLAGAAIFLASDASNFINGHILYVDGGILAYIGKQP